MPKHIRSWNKNKFEQKLSIGCGSGEGKEYKPWITIQDFSSQGMVSRVRSHKTGRVHHFLSRNELYYFYALEWSDKVLDIREQSVRRKLYTGIRKAHVELVVVIKAHTAFHTAK